jgi:hypothetical protein
LVLTVPVERVAEYLACGWVVLLPSRPHPVGDAYGRVPIQWLCSCQPVEPNNLDGEEMTR